MGHLPLNRIHRLRGTASIGVELSVTTVCASTRNATIRLTQRWRDDAAVRSRWLSVGGW